MKKALFLDRDGVINHLVLYESGWDSPQSSDDVKLIDGIEKIVSWANKKNILVIEISNQPGVAKGKMSQKKSDAIEKRIHQILKEKGGVIDKVFICPHHPNAVVSRFKKVCECRKPRPGLLLDASKALKINLGTSIFLGDKASDVLAGKAAGVTTILHLHDEDANDKVAEAKNSEPDYKVASIKKALKTITEHFKSE